LSAGDEVDFFTLHITCVYTFSRTVKAQSRRSIEPRCLSLVGPIEPGGLSRRGIARRQADLSYVLGPCSLRPLNFSRLRA
jgi:hypothetical protein